LISILGRISINGGLIGCGSVGYGYGSTGYGSISLGYESLIIGGGNVSNLITATIKISDITITIMGVIFFIWIPFPYSASAI
jgi:hypothetical protein